jgi:hypothetical protein
MTKERSKSHFVASPVILKEVCVAQQSLNTDEVEGCAEK